MYFKTSRLSRLVRVTGFVVLALLLTSVKYSPKKVRSFATTDQMLFQFNDHENYSPQNLTAQAERWVIVDGTDVPLKDLIKLQDVPGWWILVFDGNGRNFRDKQCEHCFFIETFTDVKNNLPNMDVVHMKIGVFLLAISHGAKWIYYTKEITNIVEQLNGFDFGQRMKGLLYSGEKTFDPDRHFGVKDMTIDPLVRNQHVLYKLGDYVTPSVQTKWRPSHHFIKNPDFDIENVACKLPRAMVPARNFPVSDLTGSLIGQRSFWVLGSLVSEQSPFLNAWWVLIMRHFGDVIGSYPPSCKNGIQGFEYKDTQISRDLADIFPYINCTQNSTIHACGVHTAGELQKRGFLTRSDVVLVQSWFHALSKINYKESEGGKVKDEFLSGAVHQVVFEQTSKTHSEHFPSENPFRSICNETVIASNVSAAPPIRDILLIVIFNYPSYYSNILYLDYLYRQYFTNIIYCGSTIGNFGLFQRQYLKPVTFMEINEIDRGVYGYMCASYAMEMGYKVKGYLQMSDDVLLNMWNLKNLPRDKIWFQKSIRMGSLKQNSVPNITPIMKDEKWWPWSDSQWGVNRLRELWAHFGLILKTPERLRVQLFLKQLETSFGHGGGAFYEASDIFYVPDKYKDNFSYFSKLSFSHHLYLEIAIPTMLCGFDDIKNVFRLQGTYLWYEERNIDMTKKKYKVSHHFLHTWKLKTLMGIKANQDFFCKSYLPPFETKKNLA